MSEPLRVCIVGAGKAGTNLAMALAECPDADVVRVVSRTETSARRLADALGIEPSGTDLAQALDDPTVDAVVVATPDKLHCEQAVAAAKAGKHVLCEKPMCRSVEEAQAMIEAARDARVTLMIGFTERFNQPCLEAKKRIEAGEIGDPVMILARRCHPKSLVRGRDWLNDDETGGVLCYAGTHNIDLICWYMDAKPTRVYAEMGQLVLKGQDFTDCAAMTFRFDNGAVAVLYESFAYPDPYPHGVDRSVEILGTRGCLNLDLMQQPLHVHSGEGYSIGDAVTWPKIEGCRGVPSPCLSC
ncbi:MAG: Gfo/Idh/MocA family oxidoreductase [Lentisphaerae bacterium]|nr:Gfo/Idh/MocA family oxidoreductase [Lentisphaerota bacterium]